MCIGKRNYRLYLSYIISLGVMFIFMYIQTIDYIIRMKPADSIVPYTFNLVLSTTLQMQLHY